MPEIFKKNIKRAVANVISFGDTDVFPHSFENILIRQNREEFVNVIETVSLDFDTHIETHTPQFESTLVPAGYNGYRWVTQIDPFWNAYLLASIIRHGSDIEVVRLPASQKHVHSYRFDEDESKDTLYLPNNNWHSFMAESHLRAQSSKYVVITDISEFYRRIYHHRLENALNRSCEGNVPKKILKLLTKFSGGSSYGIPVGGPASRMLAELVLNQTDQLLVARGISFCRFVDDFHIFSDTEQDAYKAIQVLSELLITNQGLSLQKSKTRIIPSNEFIATFPKHLLPDSKPQTDRERLFSLALNFDPYSPSAQEDFEALKASLGQIDFLALLNEELTKSQAHAPTITKLIKALKVTKGKLRSQAIATLLENLEILYPVLSQLLIVLSTIIEEIEPEDKKAISEKLLSLIEEKSYLIELDVHKCYAIKILARYNDYRVDAVFTEWLNHGSPFLKRDIIIGFVARNGWDHLSDLKNRVAGETPWVRRAMIAASYGLGDEGKHWRQAQNFNVFEKFTQDSASRLGKEKLGELL